MQETRFIYLSAECNSCLFRETHQRKAESCITCEILLLASDPLIWNLHRLAYQLIPEKSDAVAGDVEGRILGVGFER
jgi:hypothetical protein